jgi:ABC-type multidrug transport system fused ATPase/permease subunit
MERFEVERFEHALDRVQRADKRAARLQSITGPVLELLAAIAGAFLFVYAARRIAEGKLTAGECGVFALALWATFQSIRNLAKITTTCSVVAAAAFSRSWICPRGGRSPGGAGPPLGRSSPKSPPPTEGAGATASTSPSAVTGGGAGGGSGAGKSTLVN